jgi:RHS repeat-associated protein
MCCQQRRKSFYKGQSGYNSSNSVLTDLLGQFINALNNNNLNNKGATVTNINNNINTGANDYFNNNMAPGSGTDPKAGICWILFDEQLNYVTANFDRVSSTTGTNGVLKNHSFNVPIVKSGYLYVYASNESNVQVFFDNLQLIHHRGPLVDETHYYAFGLTMAGISSKAASFGGAENKKKYQNYEYNSDFDINLYESFYRSHDPQLGRFCQIDPKPNEFESLFAAMGNNPIKNLDVLGDSINVDKLYEKDGDGNYKNVTQIAAFEEFAKTKEGNKYILDRSQKGFKLKGAFSNLDINVKKEGSLSKKGIDINFIGTHEAIVRNGMLGDAATDQSEINGRLKIDFTLGYRNISDTKTSDNYRNVMLMAVDDISHEVFLHGDLLEKKFLKSSTVNPYDHSNFEKSKYGGESKGVSNGYGLSILKQVQSTIQTNTPLKPHSDNWLLGRIVYPSAGFALPSWIPEY